MLRRGEISREGCPLIGGWPQCMSCNTVQMHLIGLAWQPNTRKLALLNALVERLHAV